MSPDGRRLWLFGVCLWLACAFKLTCLAYFLPVIGYQGWWRHFLNVCLLIPWVTLVCWFRRRIWLAPLFSVLIALGCVMHEVAWKALGDILSLLSVEQLSLVGYAGAGFVSTLALRDLVYFVDLPIWFWWSRRAPRGEIRPASLGLAFLVGILVQAWLWGSFSPLERNRLLERRKNLGIMLTAGVVEYHLVDTLDFLAEFATRDRYVAVDPQIVETNLDQLRRSWSAPGPLAGAWKGKNLWFIQLESLQRFALEAEVEGQPVMPFLRSLAQRSLLLSQCYDQTASGVSLDCDFLVNNSLLPSVGRPTFYRYRNTRFYSLTHLLNELGYLTIYTQDGDPSFFNLPVITKRFGYQVRHFVNETPPDPTPEELIGIGMRDYAMLFRVLRGLESVQGRFFAHIVCQMGHSPFRELRPEQEMLRLPPALQGTTMGNYLQMCRFRDEELRKWFAEFSASPLSKNTVLCFYGDHAAPLPREELARVLGHPLQPLEYAEQQRIVCFLYDGIHQQTVSKACGLIDFAPTIVYLLGAVDKSPVWLGRNIFSPVLIPIVCRRYGFVVTPDGIRGLDDSESAYPALKADQNEAVQLQLNLSERLCLQNQIRKFVKGAAP